MFRRAAISFSAEATSSAWARLSSWHGPAMIEIGKSLPNLTDPAATTAAAEMLAFKALSSLRRDHAGRHSGDRPSRPCSCRSFHRGEGGRHQQLVDDIADDLAVLLGLGARRDPVGIALKCGPFLLALGERFPRQEIGQ